MRKSSWIGILLVVGGAIYFLEQINVLPDTSRLLHAGVLWPLIFVVWGIDGLRTLRRGVFPWWSMFLIVWGLGMSLRATGYFPALGRIDFVSLFTAIFVVFLGISMILPKRFGGRMPIVRVEISGKDRHKYREYGRRRRHDGGTSRWIGDLSIGNHPWVLKDMNLWNGVGDIRVNLASAHIEDGSYRLDVGGWIGDVRILVPHALPVTVHADVSIGDVSVFGHNESGGRRHVEYTDPAFSQSTKQVEIYVDLKIGDIQIVRV